MVEDEFETEEIESQSILVTGASSGIGFELCQYLLDAGHFVIGVSRSGNEFLNDNYLDLRLDLREESAVDEIVEVLEEQVYGLHMVVNCVGFFEMSSVEELTSESFMDHLQTNVMGVFHTLKGVENYLIENDSHVITLSSLAAKKGLPHFSAYCSSKAAVERLIESVREEWKEYGLRFTTLMPGPMDTPLWDELTKTDSDFDRGQMLEAQDFLHVFVMLFNSPKSVQFPEIHFAHRAGVLE